MSPETAIAVKAERRNHGPEASQRIARRSKVKLSLHIYTKTTLFGVTV